MTAPTRSQAEHALATLIHCVRPADQIEQIVGIRRHSQAHFGRAVSAERTVYILHSQRCLDSGIPEVN